MQSPENEFVFEIQSGDPANNFFAINPFTGVITVRQGLDQSVPNSYVVCLVVYSNSHNHK